MRTHLTGLFPGIDAREGRAQAIPLRDASADALICAQSFHLYATAEALAEIRRVLRPDGALGLVWNIRDTDTPWVQRIIAIMAPYEDGTPLYESGAWKLQFPAEGFTPLSERRFPNPHIGAPENIIIDRALSVSALAKLPQDERDRVVAKLRALIAATPELAGEPQVSFPNTTYTYCCRKIA
jgi:SAM-dependent methyltransferase